MLNYKVYENQKRTAEKVFNSIQLGNKNIHLVAPTQSGKTGTIIHLANMLPESNFILTSGMMSNQLFNQNSYLAEFAAPNIRAVKIHDLLKEPNPQQIIKDLNIEYVCIDENQYAIGEDSRLDKFIQELSVKCPNIVIIWIGATGYHLINSNVIDDTIQMEVPSNYYGAYDILNSGNVIDSKDFQYLSKLDSKKRKASGVDYGIKINESMTPLLEHLKSFDNGLGIVRVRSTDIAYVLKESLGNKYPYAKIIVAVSKGEGSIEESIKDAKMLSKSKRVILIVCGALKAGVDLGDTKKVVRFVVETYKNCAAITQGLVGRVCGYHNNRSCLFVANPKAIELQAYYERDYRVVNQEFLDELFEQDVIELATNLKVVKKKDGRSDKYYYGKVYRVDVNDNINIDRKIQDSWFEGYNNDYKNKVVSVMKRIKDSGGKYYLKGSEDYPDFKKDRINTLQSGKFKKRKDFDSYIRKMGSEINFSSIFHRFKSESGDRGSSNFAGGLTKKEYAEAIKVGILYDNNDKTFYIAVRDREMTERKSWLEIYNRTIFNKTK